MRFVFVTVGCFFVTCLTHLVDLEDFGRILGRFWEDIFVSETPALPRQLAWRHNFPVRPISRINRLVTCHVTHVRILLEIFTEGLRLIKNLELFNLRLFAEIANDYW